MFNIIGFAINSASSCGWSIDSLIFEKTFSNSSLFYGLACGFAEDALGGSATWIGG